MKFTIREATENDFPGILELIKELAAFEKAPEKVTNTVKQMLDEKELFSCCIASGESGEIVGMALYFIAYYTWEGKSLYLDDLYVREAYRQHKIGSALLAKVFEAAKAENCKRVRWQVLRWNEPAISFYEKLGALIDGEWLNCDYDSEGIRNFKLKATGD